MENTVMHEYKNLLEKLQNLQSNLQTLPQGYISKKTIRGQQYFYLQHRENGKIISKYIKKSDIVSVKSQIELYKKSKAELPMIKNRLSELEQAAKLLDKNLSRKLAVLKLSFNMDSLTTEQKNDSISFANSMNAIEGVFASATTQTKITDWEKGAKTFVSVFNETLSMYGFETEVDNA
ncbi:MAG: hypothetical protein R3Y09_01280 [Clostridia bacterium]